MKLLFMFPFLVIATISSDLITNRMSKIIALSIPKQSCVYLFGSGKSAIFEAISRLPIAIYVIDDLHFDEKMYGCKSTGYILEYDDQREVEDLFGLVQIFRPHNRILVVATSGCDVKRMVMRAKYHALEVIWVELVRSELMGMLPEALVDIQVVNLLQNLDEENFNLEPWKPTFEGSLKVLTLPYSQPFIYKAKNALSGFLLKIIKYLTNSWPIQLIEYPENRWDLIIADLKLYNGNVSLALFWQHSITKHDLDMTYPYSYVESTFIVPKPRARNLANLILRPFQNVIWCLIFLSMIITTKIMHHCVEDVQYSFVDCVFISTNYLVLNSLSYQFTKRLCAVVFMWSVYSLLLATAYSAGFSSVVSIPGVTKEISTFGDLFESKLKCTVANAYVKKLFEQSSDQYLTLISNNIHFDLDAPTKCIGGDVVYNRYMITPKSIDHQEDWMMLREFYQSTSFVIALNKNSPYTQIFDGKIKRLHEFGLIQFWFTRGKIDFPNVWIKSGFNAEGTPHRAFTIVKMQSVFYLWLGGILMSTLCFVYESNDRVRKIRGLIAHMATLQIKQAP